MLIQDFELLTVAEKETVIWEYAQFLVNFDQDNILCDVYELFDFYVSLSYQLNRNEKAEIAAALHPNDLPYMTGIKYKPNKLASDGDRNN